MPEVHPFFAGNAADTVAVGGELRDNRTNREQAHIADHFDEAIRGPSKNQRFVRRPVRGPVMEILAGRGHALSIGGGGCEGADCALLLVQRFAYPMAEESD